MQLARASKASAPRRRQLGLAVMTLFGGSGAGHAQSGPGNGEAPAQVDSGLLWYRESDQRITDLEAIVSVRQPLTDDRAWIARLTLDSVCGGSPIGALPSKSAQSFVTPTATSLNPAPAVQTTTSSSGGGGLSSLSLCSNPVQNQHYSVAPGLLPIDRSFHDQRIALNGGYETPLAALTRLSLGGALSHELDFLSGSVNASLARDFNDRNTTISAGLNLEADAIEPIGGTPVAGSPYGLFDKGGNRSKKVETAVLGATQIMNRRWLTQGNLSVEHAAGYETDPYKIVSVLDAQGYAPANPTGDYLYERRPDARNRWSLFWDNRYAFDQGVLQGSYRHTQDSWGVRSDTLEMHYRLAMGTHGYLEAHLREYRQSAADIFRFSLDAGTPPPAYFSADPRLAAFNGQTLGIKYALPMDDTGGELSLRVERYTQRGSGPSNVPVGLQGLDLYPGMSAWIVQLGARFSF
jgi:hypothetical protein